MRKQVFIQGIILALLLTIAVLWMTVRPGLEASVADQHGRGRDDDFSFRASPEKRAYQDETVTLTAKPWRGTSAVSFAAQNGKCTQQLGIDNSAPFTLTWEPKTSPCGIGKYSLTATAHLGRKQEKEKIKYTILARSTEVLIDTTTRTGENIVIDTSSDVYPPEPGSAPSQTVATIPIGPTETPNERFAITGNITGKKVSGGSSFNLEYRLLDGVSGAVLATGVLTNPLEPQTQSFSATLTAPTNGTRGELKLQFRSTELFSAVAVTGYALTVEHYGVR